MHMILPLLKYESLRINEYDKTVSNLLPQWYNE